MSNELIAIIGIGVALATLTLHGQHNLRNDIQSLRAETGAESKALREETQAEFKVVREEMRALREETRAEFKAVREETQAEFKAVREEMRSLREQTRAAINGLLERLSRVEERIARLEVLFKGRRVAAENSAPG